MDHGDHTMPETSARCSMNMLWNSQVADTCVVFRSWHIHGWVTMTFSCFCIILISISYSMLLNYTRRQERILAFSLYQETKGGSAESSRRDNLIPPVPIGYSAVDNPTISRMGVTKLPLRARVTRAALYAASVAISFFLMLVAMTYNTYLFISIIIGAFTGHFLYEDEMDVGALFGPGSKGLACH